MQEYHGFNMKFITNFLFILLGLFCFSYSGLAQKVKDNKQASEPQRPKIGLALSGGGARGAAHVGVIKRLEELNIPIDYIAATSMGAIVGGLYASGMSVTEIETAMKELGLEEAFSDQGSRENRSFRRKRDDDLYVIKYKVRLNKGKPSLPSGIVAGQKVDFLLRSLTLDVSGVKDFDSLSIPFRAVATDIVTGDEVILGSGDLAMAIRASMSLPAIFTPVEIGDRYLVDGGVSNNLPISVVRQMGADIVIAIDISSPLYSREQLDSFVSITEQLTGILTKKNSTAQIKTLTEKDLLITPQLGDITLMSFDKADKAIAIGYESVKPHINWLQNLAINMEQYDQHIIARERQHKQNNTIDTIQLINNSSLADETILANISIEIGDQFDLQQVERNIDDLYGWQLFQTVNYDLITDDDDKTNLIINIDEIDNGPSYLQFGMELSDNFSGENTFNLALAYTNPVVNHLRGELRAGLQIGQEPTVSLEFYQPLDIKARYFIHPRLAYQKLNVPAFVGNNIISEFRVKTFSGELGAGRNLGNWGELKTGLRYIDGTAKVSIGNPDDPNIDFEDSQWFAQFTYDTLDSVNFPARGSFLSMQWVKSIDVSESDVQFNQFIFNSLNTKTLGNHTLLFRTVYGTTTSGTAPIQNLFRLGGFGNLSGLNNNQLSGQHYGLLSGTYHKKLGNSSLLPAYIGGSLELGNVWQSKDDIGFKNSIFAGNVFVGADTIIGPLYLAYGKTENNEDSLYLFLGRIF